MKTQLNLDTCTNLLEQLDKRHHEWSFKTFGHSRGPAAPAAHLLKEAHELLEKPSDLSEAADVLLLLLDVNRRAGRTVRQLLQGAHAKQQINEMREWGPPDANGVCEHVRNPIAATADQMTKNLS